MQKRFIQDSVLGSFGLAVLQVALLAGCSGADAMPPTLDEISGAPAENMTENHALDGTSSTGAGAAPAEGGCDNEGAIQDCRTPIAARDGYYLCGLGHQTCQGHSWSTCTTHETSAGEDQWTPIAVGCDAPPERCDRDGAARKCVQHLPPSAGGENNCYHGQQLCTDGAWSTCIQTGL